ncbi:hypothetical protein BN134_2999 [Cronobacter dublinensis 1210]|uniref:Uncharacterized protein n=1 Tax=Cronobacter dublinensis 1210 TaxID=1208656 RepID=A0ABM9Q9P6_9ENTR|nr:hypothetical protein BN134_2999 [Cronobacter dublinensis 1210]
MIRRLRRGAVGWRVLRAGGQRGEGQQRAAEGDLNGEKQRPGTARNGLCHQFILLNGVQRIPLRINHMKTLDEYSRYEGA